MMFPKIVGMTAVFLLLAACGLKGPLYRPGEQQQDTPVSAAESDKLRRPRPAPQVQKEDRPSSVPSDTSAPPDMSAPVTPVNPDQAPDTPPPVESMPADESR